MTPSSRSDPKLHHYVPRFYLNGFLNEEQRLWVYDKAHDKIFQTVPKNIAAETQFYRLPPSIAGRGDPLRLEKALAGLEARASLTMKRLITEVPGLQAHDPVTLPHEERVIISEFIATQYLRTLDARQLFQYLVKSTLESQRDLTDAQLEELQFLMLFDPGIFEELAESIHKGIWIFAINDSAVQLITSDNPVGIKAADSKSWLKHIGPLADGQYVVYPLSPTVVLYCYEASYWPHLRPFDLKISPVRLNSEMAEHENCGQAFTSSRFLISSGRDFDAVREFIPSIGTDLHAPPGRTNQEEIRRTAEFLAGRKRS